MWLDQVRAELGDGLEVNWKYFSLEQLNSAVFDFKLWEVANDGNSSSLRQFQAAHAARKQGDAAFRAFHAVLFAKRHVDGRNLSVQDVLEGVATEAGLDLDQFRCDLASEEVRPLIKQHWDEASALGVFGVPTIVFDNEMSAYFQLDYRNLPKDPAVFWNEFVTTVRDRPEVREIKRPRRPS